MATTIPEIVQSCRFSVEAALAFGDAGGVDGD